jgi:hypothetical protein
MHPGKIAMLASCVAKYRRARNMHFPNYIFIHINKTAGSSIERALYLRFEHKTAAEKLAELGVRRWRCAFKFAFVRNPWTRALSHYLYRVKTNQTGLGNAHLTFGQWVKTVYRDKNPRYRDQERMFQNQWSWLSDESGSCIVDFIGRFEELELDFTYVCGVLAKVATLPHLKKSPNARILDYYDAESQAIVGRHYSIDIEKFAYEFPGSPAESGRQQISAALLIPNTDRSRLEK